MAFCIDFLLLSQCVTVHYELTKGAAPSKIALYVTEMNHPFAGYLASTSTDKDDSGKKTINAELPPGRFGITIEGTLGDISSNLRIIKIETAPSTCTAKVEEGTLLGIFYIRQFIVCAY